MPKENLISVIVPVYHAEKYLSRCIESLINQTYRNLEIILVDDGSTDDSGRICDEYANKDERIKVIHQKNMGVSGARNTGLDAVQGEFIGFVDSDDFIEPTMYEILYKYVREYQADIIQCGYYQQLGSANYVVGNSEKVKIYDSFGSLKALLSERCPWWFLWSKLCSAKLFRQLRFFTDLQVGEDVCLIAELFFQIRKLIYVEKPLYHYQQNPDSLTRNGNPAILDTFKADKHIAKLVSQRYPQLTDCAWRAYGEDALAIYARSILSQEKNASHYEMKKKIRSEIRRYSPRIVHNKECGVKVKIKCCIAAATPRLYEITYGFWLKYILSRRMEV